MDWIKDNYPELINNPIIRSILIIFGSMIIAKITDLIFTGIIKRLTSKTRTELDDQIVVLFHKPILNISFDRESKSTIYRVRKWSCPPFTT